MGAAASRHPRAFLPGQRTPGYRAPAGSEARSRPNGKRGPALGIGLFPPRHHVDDPAVHLGIAPAIEPVPTGSGAVGPKMRKIRDEFPFFADRSGRVRAAIIDIVHVIAVHLLSHAMDINALDLTINPLVTVIPGQIDDGLGASAPFLLAESLDPPIE